MKFFARLVASRTFGAQVLAVADQASVSASTFGTTALIARNGGLDTLGTFTVVWMIVLLVNAAQNAIVIAPMASLSPSRAEDAPAFYAYYVRTEARFLGAVASASILSVMLAAWLTPGAERLVAASAVAVLAYQVYDFVRRYAHAVTRHVAATLLSGSIAVIQLGSVAAVGLAGRLTAPAAFAAIAVSMLVPSVAAGGVLLPRSAPRDFDPGLAGRSWRSSRWLLGSAVMQWTCGNLFVLLAPAFVGLWAAGALRAAQSIVGVVNIWHQGLENVLPLHAGKLWRGAGPKDAARYVGRVSLAWTAVTGLFVATVSLFSDPLLHAVYGAEVAAYAWVLRWYAALQLIIFVGLPLRSLLRAAEETRGIFLAFAAATVFSVTGVVPLLRFYGLAGALIGLSGAQLVFQCVLALHLWRHFSSLGHTQPLTLTTT